MNRHQGITRPLAWLMTLLLAVLVAGCGGGGGGGQDPILGGAGNPALVPTVTAVTPLPNAVGVPLNTKAITAAFTKAMDSTTLTPTSFTLACPTGSLITGVVSYLTASNLATLTLPAATNLPPNTLCVATVTTGAKDTSGVALANNFTWSFTTGAVLDSTAPTVTSTINANGATGVALNTKVGATFSEAMDPLTITNLSFNLKQGLTDIQATVTYAGVNAVLTPTNNLLANTLYTATITTGAKDLAGNAMASNYVWSWTTAAALDTTPPTITLENPANLATAVAINSSVNAKFSEAMDPLTINSAAFTLQASGPPLGTLLTGTVSYDAVAHIATFTPTSNLAPSTSYSATISGVKDLAGNPLAAGLVPNPWTFTTAAGSGLAPGAIALGSASTFGIMATSAITNTGLSTINGDVSLNPGTSMSGFPPGVVNGAIHINDTVSALARADLLTAYNTAKSLPPGTTISAGADLGALYPLGIPPGTYTSGSTMLISTPLILDAGGNANATWVFQIGSSLTTSANVSLSNGAQAKNVFWVPTSDATIGVGTVFYGTIVSGRDVTGVTGATINGRILAGAITAGTIALDGNTVNVPAP